MDGLEVLKHWELIAAGVGGIVWLVRLEARSKGNEQAIGRAFGEIAEVRTKHETLNSKTVDELARVREALARIEGILSARAEADRAH